jgi:hypothetical protein
MAEDQEPKAKPEKEPKARKITHADYKKAETALKAELAKRKTSQFRQHHELMWKVVDRQVSLTPMESESSDQNDGWLNSFELGVLAQASEVMTADLLRIIFPDARAWFDAHTEIVGELDVNTGDKLPTDKKIQSALDGRVRAMMTQQHVDFGLRDRVELSIKEALHHGAFVAEIVEDSMDMYLTGTSIKEVSAPVWKPHSMWNCWPDPSPSLVGANMYYTGSMFVRYYQPRHKFMEAATGEGWIKSALKKIPKEEHDNKGDKTKDLEIVVYWGDVVIPKNDGMETSAEDMFFPNHKAIMANGKMVYLDANITPYPPIIYKGYEKMDVRDPYFLSPIIKQSPLQKIASILANEFVNSVQLHTRPPIVYDGNDPDFVVNGGPIIAPGSKTSTKGSATFKQIEIGDPKIALEGVQYCTQTMKESLGRPGIQVGNRATAEEVNKKQADSEAGPHGFAAKMDDALRTFLYMQNALNKAKKGFKYTYYSPEMDSPDFLRVESKDLPDTIHFEVTGSKGVLGEQRRHQAFIQTTQFVAGHPMFGPLLQPMDVVKQLYQDAGIKSPERFLKTDDGIPPQIKQQIQQMQQQLQQMQQQLKDEKAQTQVKMTKIQNDHQDRVMKMNGAHHVAVEKLKNTHQVATQKLELSAAQLHADNQVKTGNLAHQLKVANLEKTIARFESNMRTMAAQHSQKPKDHQMGIEPEQEPTKFVNDQGHALHQDAQGNYAYVGPNGEVTEI